MKLKVFLAGLSASIMFATPLLAEAPAQKKEAAGGGKVVFDLTHNEIFSPVKKGPLDYSDFYKSIGGSGQEAAVSRVPIVPNALEEVKTYVIAGPSKALEKEEVEVLKEFVKNGGNLLVLLHISSPVAELTEAFGIIVSNFVISERENVIAGQSQDFYVTRFSRHPVNKGISKIAVFGTWGLMAEEGAQVIASTSVKAWADMDRNRKFDHGEPVQSFGIVAAAEYGSGKVVVVADDAPFANKFLPKAGNRRLADNIIRWFRQ